MIDIYYSFFFSQESKLICMKISLLNNSELQFYGRLPIRHVVRHAFFLTTTHGIFKLLLPLKKETVTEAANLYLSMLRVTQLQNVRLNLHNILVFALRLNVTFSFSLHCSLFFFIRPLGDVLKFNNFVAQNLGLRVHVPEVQPVYIAFLQALYFRSHFVVNWSSTKKAHPSSPPQLHC